MLDDSIVRGTTQRQLVGLLRDIGGAAEVHVRITSPPVRWPCFLGIDIPDPAELIAHELPTSRRSATRIGADSLEYLSEENLVPRRSAPRPTALCLGCFTRDYPIDVQLPLRQARARATGRPRDRRWCSRVRTAVWARIERVDADRDARPRRRSRRAVSVDLDASRGWVDWTGIR